MKFAFSQQRRAGAFGKILAGVSFAAVMSVCAPAAYAEGGTRYAGYDSHDVTNINTPKIAAQLPYDRTAPRKMFDGPGPDFTTLSWQTMQALQLAVNKYAAITAAGGWPQIPDDRTLRLHTRDPNVSLLRQRLMLTGDLESNPGRSDRIYDAEVELAVKRFQYRNGLRATGEVDPATLIALNVPALDRLNQLRINLVRLHALSENLPSRYVLVNIPAAEVQSVEGDTIYSRHTAIVGKPDRQSPVLVSAVHELNFSPYWHVPRSIIRRDIIPKMQEDPEYLNKYQIRIYDNKLNEIDPTTIDWHSEEAMQYSFRQDPGEDLNSLGAVKLNFFNKHAVFLHDTPGKELFDENYRAFSSGCVRVENIEYLITWLLQNNSDDNGTWSSERVSSTIASGERLDVKLEEKVPIYMVYVTAWATPNGIVHFRRDLYGRDGVDQTASSY